MGQLTSVLRDTYVTRPTITFPQAQCITGDASLGRTDARKRRHNVCALYDLERQYRHAT